MALGAQLEQVISEEALSGCAQVAVWKREQLPQFTPIFNASFILKLSQVCFSLT